VVEVSYSEVMDGGCAIRYCGVSSLLDHLIRPEQQRLGT
jgi:hypothetical protein